MLFLCEILAHLEDHERFQATRAVLCVLTCDGQSGAATRGDRGEARKTKCVLLTGPREPPCRSPSTGWSGGRRDRGRGELRPVFTGAPVEKARQGRINCTGVANVNNFSGLQAKRIMPGCLVPGAEMIRPEEYFLLGCRLRRCGSELVRIGQLQGMGAGNLSPAKEVFNMSKHHNIYRK